MAVTSCAYARDPISGSSDERNRGTYTVRYQIMANTRMGPKELTAGAIASSPNALPAMWATYAYQSDADTNAYAQRYEVSLVAHGRATSGGTLQDEWLCVVTFSPLPEGSGSSWTNSDPTARGARYWWDREVYTEIIERDVFGQPIVNTAKQPYDEPLEQEASRSVLVIEKNVSTLAQIYSYASTYENAVNSVTWSLLSAPPRTALCREIVSSQRIVEGATSYYTVSFRIALAENGKTWDRFILSRGFKHWAPVRDAPAGTTRLVHGTNFVLDAQGFATGEVEPVTEPVLLDINGFRLSEGAAAIYTGWRTYREVSFAGIPT